ncbi:MAG: trypsin-like peptidase domain-containing protein [Candidatus Sericytochromatia bacterium]
MSLLKKLILSISTLSVMSCSLPSQVLNNKTSEVPEILTKIQSSKGEITDEDINIAVYKASIKSVVGVNTTSTARTVFSFRTVQGTGSGVIISKDGYILTNYHVINGARKISIDLTNNVKIDASIIGGNKENDVALIKANLGNNDFTIASFGNSDGINVGQKVLAIGSPFGLDGTLTTGIISSLNRSLPAEDGTVLKNIIQTDAAINPGNSGGPLLNAKGEIIGLNTAIFSPNGANVGIGFAIPINKVKEVLESLGVKII